MIIGKNKYFYLTWVLYFYFLKNLLLADSHFISLDILVSLIDINFSNGVSS